MNKATLAKATNDELITELSRRGALAPLDASVVVDGRFVRETVEETAKGLLKAKPQNVLLHPDDTEEAYKEAQRGLSNFIEYKLLGTLAGSLAQVPSGAPERVHTFDMEPAHGDMAPGSMLATIRLLAVVINVKPEMTGEEIDDVDTV